MGKDRFRGFTLVELLIVIAVMGILASIVLVMYPGYRQRANDDTRKSDIQQIASALSAYAIQKNSLIGTGSGCGKDGNGNGWLSAGPSQIASYPKSIYDCLKDANLLADGDFIDPSGCLYNSGGNCGTNPAQAYMKVTCQKGSNTVTYVLTHLESQPRKDAEVDALCDSGTVSGFDVTTQKWGTNHGMNYYVSVR